jgi:hypothetical protein
MLPSGRSWPNWLQLVVSLALAFHFCALLAAALAAPPNSPLEAQVFQPFKPYCDLIDQNVGYRYYSQLDTTVDPRDPRPWWVPVVTAEMTFEDKAGPTRRETLRLPDFHHIWPRLRHQRRIDLAYHLAADPRWAASYARHLCLTRGCDRVTISSQQHRVPDPARLRALLESGSRIDLEAESKYSTSVTLGEFRCTEFSDR